MPTSVAIITTKMSKIAKSTKWGYKKGRPNKDDYEEDDDDKESRRNDHKYNRDNGYDNINDDHEDKDEDEDEDDDNDSNVKSATK